MSSNKRHGGFRPLVAIGCAITICVVAALLVTSGAWDRFASSVAFLNTTGTSTSALMPSDKDQEKLGLHAILPNPSGSSDSSSKEGESNDTTVSSGQENTATGLPTAAASPISIQQALQYAQATKTATPHTEGYDRTQQFGTWINSSQLCGTGTTRDYILQRDLTDVQTNSSCQVTSGTLHDPYTGKTINFTRGKNTSTLVQIDHVVALNDAYASGLWEDSRADDRVTYANDPEVLLASDGAANNTKSAGINLRSAGKARSQWDVSTPSIWLPDNTEYQCEYMAKRVYIKHKYNLTMSSWEKTETVNFLTQCAAQ